MAKKKTAGKPTTKKATAKPAVAPATTPTSKNGKLDWATIIDDKLIARYDSGKELTLALADVNPLHKEFGSVEVQHGNLIIPIRAHFLKIPGSKLQELALPPVAKGDMEQQARQFSKLLKIYQNFPKWAKQEMKRRNITQQQLGDRMGITNPTVNVMIKEGKKAKPITMFRIMQALNIDPRKL